MIPIANCDQYEIDDDDLLDNCYATSEAESEEDNDDFSMINPDLLDFFGYG